MQSASRQSRCSPAGAEDCLLMEICQFGVPTPRKSQCSLAGALASKWFLYLMFITSVLPWSPLIILSQMMLVISLFQKQFVQSASRQSRCSPAGAEDCLLMDICHFGVQTPRKSQCSLAGALASKWFLHLMFIISVLPGDRMSPIFVSHVMFVLFTICSRSSLCNLHRVTPGVRRPVQNTTADGHHTSLYYVL